MSEKSSNFAAALQKGSSLERFTTLMGSSSYLASLERFTTRLRGKRVVVQPG